jgi:hypothetical protein
LPWRGGVVAKTATGPASARSKASATRARCTGELHLGDSAGMKSSRGSGRYSTGYGTRTSVGDLMNV